MLLCGSTFEGGLSKFYTNTSQDYSIISGLSAGVIVSSVISVAISWKTHVSGSNRRKLNTRPNGHPIDQSSPVQDGKVGKNAMLQSDDEDEHCDDGELEWQKTMSIDNPLYPFRNLYREQLKRIGISTDHITTRHLSKLFKRARFISGICALGSFVVFIVVIPLFALSQTILSQAQMETWILVCQYWCFIATFLVVVVPPVQEGLLIWRKYKANQSERDENIPCQVSSGV